MPTPTPSAKELARATLTALVEKFDQHYARHKSADIAAVEGHFWYGGWDAGAKVTGGILRGRNRAQHGHSLASHS